MKLWHWVVITWMATFCVGTLGGQLFIRHQIIKNHGKAMWEIWK